MCNGRWFSLREFVKETHANAVIIDFLIRSRHKYLILHNYERCSWVLVRQENYAGLKEENGVYYVYTKKPVIINGKSPIQVFEIDFNNDIDDIIGFPSIQDIQLYCSRNELRLNCAETLSYKLIFSPQLANYLLRRGFRVLELKPHREHTGEAIYVFAVEDGFYQAIDNFRKGNINDGN